MTNLFMKVNKDLFKIGLSPIELLVLAQVMEFNTNTGDCFISNQTMAANFGVSEKTISRTVAALEERGLLVRNTKNVQKGKERHMSADLAKIEAAIEKAAKDKMTLAKQTNDFTKDKLSIPQETNCPFRKSQNDPIKDNSKKINLKDKREIDEMSSATLRTVSSISEQAPQEGLEEISPEALIAMGARYEITPDDLIKIIDTGKLFRIKQ